MKKEIKKKINDFEKRALMWSDVEGADELKDNFDKFNACYKIVEKDSYCNRDKIIFRFCDDLVRKACNKPFCSKWETIPEELTEYYDRVLDKMNKFIDRGLLAVISTEGFSPKWNSDFGYDENNTALEVAGYASYNQALEEKISFKVGVEDFKTEIVTFKVVYGDLKAEQTPYFSTTANTKDMGGDGLLPKGTVVRAFWEKWGMYHLKMLTRAEYDEMLSDLEIVKADPLAMNEEV